MAEVLNLKIIERLYQSQIIWESIKFANFSSQIFVSEIEEFLEICLFFNLERSKNFPNRQISFIDKFNQ